MSQKQQPEESSGSRGGGMGVPARPNPGSGAHRRGEPKRQRVPALRKMITEVMRKSNIQKLFMAIEPLIRRVVRQPMEPTFFFSISHPFWCMMYMFDLYPLLFCWA